MGNLTRCLSGQHVGNNTQKLNQVPGGRYKTYGSLKSHHVLTDLTVVLPDCDNGFIRRDLNSGNDLPDRK
jgi:hypothetical protein